MKNDTSPSARQPYSYADALRSLLIIPPSDRQPPSRRGAHPAGQSAPKHGLQPPAPSRQPGEVSPPPAPWRSLLPRPRRPHAACSASLGRAGGGDRPPGRGDAALEPSLLCCPQEEPSGTGLQTRLRVWQLKSADGHPSPSPDSCVPAGKARLPQNYPAQTVPSRRAPPFLGGSRQYPTTTRST